MMRHATNTEQRLSARTRRRLGDGQRAFTLVEMLVSLAVLSLALSIVGVVFTTTTKTASTAAAYSETSLAVRQIMDQLQQDLDEVDPAKSVLLLAGRTQAGGLSTDDRDAGRYQRFLVGNPANVGGNYDPTGPNPDPTGTYSDPRADILMFFTNRALRSQAAPLNPNSNSVGAAAANGAKFAPALVTYGHAAVGDARWNGTQYQYDDNVVHIQDPAPANSTLSALPLYEWRLVRRQALICPPDPNQADVWNKAHATLQERERINQCKAPQNAANSDYPGDTLRLNYAEVLARLSSSAATSPAMFDPYNFPNGDWFGFYLTTTPVRDAVESWLYRQLPGIDGVAKRYIATVIRNVPADLRSNLGLMPVQGCAWFQVEFLMPEDPRNSLGFVDPTPLGPANDSPAPTDTPRWAAVEPGETYFFVPDTLENRLAIADQVRNPVAGPVFAASLPGTRGLDHFGRLDQNEALHYQRSDALTQRIIRTWPYAIRVTVRVYDPKGRLDQPLVRSLVHRFD